MLGDQVSGEAVYTDDMPSPTGTLYAGLVLSKKPHARLLAVDPSDALAEKGVLRFLGAKDVTPLQNAIGAVVLDEEIFAVEEVCVQYTMIPTINRLGHDTLNSVSLGRKFRPLS